MPAAYSMDLRKRIIDVYETNQGSQRQIAQRFQVSLSFVKSLLRRYRNTGQIKAKPHGGGAKLVIKRSQLKQIQQLVNEQPDALLRELCQRWEEREGTKVSISTMHRKLQQLKLTTKKNSICQ